MSDYTAPDPVLGGLDLDFDLMELSADGALTLAEYTAKSGSPAADGLSLLASWAATLDDTATEPARSSQA
jgi:hypothetical protein